MKSEPKLSSAGDEHNDSKRTLRAYGKPSLRVYGTLVELTAAVSNQKRSDGGKTAAMSATT
jgi:hypothetical protein